MITAIQFRRSQALARAHGHEWGYVSVIADGQPDPQAPREGEVAVSLTFPLTAEAVGDAIEAALEPGRSMPGLSFATTHRTGSGRLFWEVLDDGHVTLCVMRPGSTLTALRRLNEACAEAWHVESLQPALTVLGGDPLREALRAARLGVTVLTAEVAAGGSVEVKETTRGDVGDNLDCAELRHWLTLREALAALGMALPDAVREAVRERLAEYDAALAPVRAASEAGEEARQAAQEAAAPKLQALYDAPLPWAPVMEVARRRGGRRSVTFDAQDGAE